MRRNHVSLLVHVTSIRGVNYRDRPVFYGCWVDDFLTTDWRHDSGVSPARIAEQLVVRNRRGLILSEFLRSREEGSKSIRKLGTDVLQLFLIDDHRGFHWETT